MSADETVAIAKSQEETPARRVLAAVAMSGDAALDVESLFYSHITLLNYFGASIVRSAAAEFLVRIFIKVWPAKMISTFALQSPRLTARSTTSNLSAFAERLSRSPHVDCF